MSTIRLPLDLPCPHRASRRDYCVVLADDLERLGRPLAASEAQCAQVLKLRNEGIPLRLIVDETSLGLQTVRTIIGRKTRSDRTSVKRIEKLGFDKSELIRAKARKRTRDALPKRINAMREQGAELITEAKGLGKARS